MTELERIKTILSEHMDELRREYHVEELGVFGSVARGDDRFDSDVDILVTLNQPLGFKFMQLERYLEYILDRNVDLVMKSGLKELIRDDILQDTRYV